MKRLQRLTALFCCFLIISTALVSAQSSQVATPASQGANPFFGGNLGGFAYTDPYGDDIRRASGRYGTGREVYLGEAINIYVSDYQPKHVRQSALEQQDQLVYVILKGLTVGTLLSPFTTDPTAKDPLSGITSIPPIDNVDVTYNTTSEDSKYIRFVRYIKPTHGRESLNNLGNVVVFLRKLENEEDMPPDNTISIDMHAKIYLRLDESNLLGISKQELTLKPFANNEEFFRNKNDYSFFSNKGFIQATRIDPDRVTLMVYNRDLRPLSLGETPLSSQASRQGLRQPVIVTLTRSDSTSPPISFGYTGNPLTDMFQIRLDEISTPNNKAEIEFQIDGRTVTRKVSEGKDLYPGSNWILRSVSVPDTSVDKVTADNIDEITKNFNLNEQAKNRLVARLNDLGGELPIMRHTITLENKFNQERKTITRDIISNNEKNQLEINVDPISTDLARFLEEKYCINENLDVVGNDPGCLSVKKFYDLIKKYPSSPEAQKAKRDLAEIYDQQLIDYKPCIRTETGKVADENENKCRQFRTDMADLAHYYYSQLGESERIVSRYGGRGGGGFLEDEGVSFALTRVIKKDEEQSTVNLRVYRDLGNYNEKNQLKQGSEVDLEVTVKFRDSAEDYVWRISSIGGDTATLRLYKKTPENSYTTISNIAPVTLKLNEARQVITSFPALNAQGQPSGSGTEESVAVELIRVDTRNEAYITIIPGAGRAFTTSDFSIHIPVDPRPFKLTPEQMESHIKTTKEIIDTLNSVIEKLDKVISTMKKMCLGVFAFLTLKNSFAGARNIARKEVSPSYQLRCQSEMLENPDKFPTMERCLNEYADEMTSATDKTEEFIDDINSKIKGKTIEELEQSTSLESPEEKEVCGGFGKFSEARKALGEKSQNIIKTYRDCLLYAKIRNSNVDETYKNYALSKLNELKTKQSVELYNKAKQFAAQDDEWDENDPAEIRRIISQFESGQQSGDITRVEIRPLAGGDEGKAGDEEKAIVPDRTANFGYRTETLRRVTQYDALVHKEEFSDETKVNEYICNKVLSDAKWENSKNICVDETNPSKSKDNLVEDRIKFLKKQTAQDGPYDLYITKAYYDQTDGFKSPPEVNDGPSCKAIGGEWKGTAGTTFFAKCKPKYYSTSFTLNTAGQLINQFYSEDPIPAYYDNNGLPFAYPVGSGNYAVVERFPGPTQRIDKVTVYNVGPNGRIESGGGDDEIVYLADALDQLPQQKTAFINKEPGARCTPKENGKKVKTIDNKDVVCKIGLPGDLHKTVLDPKCTDVMDSIDCKWLFNFCDPVMCPSSRCTLGGRVPERDVIQSGIVGSTLLCLPNVKDGIVIPVCLTGISAGLKGIRSVLEGYANCLEIKLKSGDNVGFCDYIRSVGVCELVWKEAYNLVNIGGRGVIDWVAGNVFGEVKGGGEYLTFQSSLDNVGESVRVFTNEYSTTYTAQFLSQSTDEIGTQICRLSVNGQLPSVGKILDQLTEPENPPQFTAFFDETPYAATGELLPEPNIPAGTREESLYKVFYHIYAGSGFYQGSFSQPQSLFNPGTQFGPGQPITYSVYLKNDQLGYPQLYVTFKEDFAQPTGRVEPGKFQQQTVQKRGMKGYNEICVVINGGPPQCGFGKVSSSFGLKELNNILVGNEAEQEIDSADECVPSSRRSEEYSIAKLGALATSEALGGGIATGVITSDAERGLFSTGIIRLCSAAVPTSEPGRWKEVGKCGEDERGKTLGQCWLDTKSVSIDDREINRDLQKELSGRAKENLRLIEPERAREILFALNEKRNTILDSLRADVKEAKKALPSPTTPVRTEVREIEAPATYLADTQRGIALEEELSPYINQVAIDHGINPIFIRAIIKAESNWGEDVISRCGAAGIIQLMPHTTRHAIRLGAHLNEDKILDPVPVSNVPFTRGCDKKYGDALKAFAQGKSKEQLAQVDERFDDRIAIETAIVYFEKVVRPALEGKNIPPTVENMASGYNPGPYATADAGGAENIRGTDAVKYRQDVRRYYNRLLEGYEEEQIASMGNTVPIT